MGWEGGLVFLDYFALQRHLLHSAENEPCLPSLISSSPLFKGSLALKSLFIPYFSLSLSLSFSDSISHNISWLGRTIHAHFPPPNFTSISLSLREKARQGWGNLGRSFKAKPWSTRGVCFKAGVRSSGQRRRAGLGWARLVEGALQPVWLLPSSNSQPFPPTEVLLPTS